MGAETAFLKEFVAEGVMQAQVGIAVFSASDFTVRAANPFYLQMIGCAGKDVVGKSLLSFVPQSDISSERFFKQVLLTGTSCTDHEVTVTYRDDDDGQVAWFNVLYQPLTSEAGDIHSIMVIANDVTDLVHAKRKASEKAVRRRTIATKSAAMPAAQDDNDYWADQDNDSGEVNSWQTELGEAIGKEFRLLADSLPQLIWIGNANGSLNYFNQSVFDYTGMAFDEIKGQGWIQFVHPEDRASNLHKWREAIKNGGDFLFEHRFRRYDGIYRWQLSRAIPHYDSEGHIRMWVGTSTDIHDQKAFAKALEEKVFERTKELKETNEVLEKTNRQLEQFAYIASHDLQEPLRKIQTFSDILKRNIHDDAAVRKYFAKIDSSARRMGELIKSVLDYSRLPAHPGQLFLTDLNEVLRNVKSDLELMILEKGAVIKTSPLPAIPGVPLQLNQLFSNLIGNALKFSRDKPIIRVAAHAVTGDSLVNIFNAVPSKRYVELIFEDNGIGFDNKYKDQIFTIFQRLHGLQQYSGTGIGLALCKKIVENHYGHIVAESEYQKGSTFRVYLPS